MSAVTPLRRPRGEPMAQINMQICMLIANKPPSFCKSRRALSLPPPHPVARVSDSSGRIAACKNDSNFDGNSENVKS